MKKIAPIILSFFLILNVFGQKELKVAPINKEYINNTESEVTIKQNKTIPDGINSDEKKLNDNSQQTPFNSSKTNSNKTCIDLTSPYVVNFEDTEDLSGWVFLDNNSDGDTWGIDGDSGINGTKCARNDYSTSNNADDWLFSPCITLEAGKSYKLNFYYATESSSAYPEKLKVYYGTTQDATMSNLVVDLGEFAHTDFQKSSSTINITSTDSYYFGWYCYSDADMYYPYVDSITIKEVSSSTPPTEVTIGTGTLEKGLPMHQSFDFNYSQSIFTKDEIATSGKISEIRWSYDGYSAWSDDIVIYMAETDKTEFSSTDDWIPLSTLTQVYSGKLTVTATAGWVSVTLDTPFDYTNTNNLVIAVDENSDGYHGGSDFYSSSVSSNRSILLYKDNINPDPASPPTASYIYSAIPNTQLVLDVALSGGDIVSTTTGGNWSETTTWIGGVVPTIADDVVIDGTVIVNTSTCECNNIIINSGDTLTKDNNARTLIVQGNFTNNGIITESNYDVITISVSGNLINNGKWDIGNIIFTGTNDNELSMGATDTINNSYIMKTDNNSNLIIASDTRFNNCSFSNDYANYYGGTEQSYNIKIKDGTTYKLDLLKTSNLSGIMFDGSGSSLKNATLKRESFAPTYLKNTKLYGVTVVSSDSVVFTDNNVTVEDTLKKDNNARTLIVQGNFTNNGVVTEDNYDDLTISISGNGINNGKWDDVFVEMNGTSDQKFTNNSTSVASLKLKANISSATTYQWYKNSSTITGETNETYTYNSPGNENDYDAYGVYYCQTNAGNSRTITIETTVGPAPVADFSANNTSGTAPLEVTFTDASTNNPTSWSWDFDNNGTEDATTQNPTYTYSTAGTYTVKLTVSNSTGTDNEIKTDYITVSDAVNIVAAFSANKTTGDAPLEVTFTDASTGGANSWSWDFNNDGTVDATTQNPTYTYSTAGTYTVKLTAGDGTNSDDEIKTDYITVTAASGGAIVSTTTGGNWSETTTWIGGVVPTATDSVVIDGTVIVNLPTSKCNSITVNSEGTLINSNGNAENFTVAGNFVNNGVVTKDISGYLSISVGGNVINNGKWDGGYIIFTGTDDNEIIMGTTDIISNCYINKDDNISYLVIGSDARFDNCVFSNIYSNPYKIKIKEGSNYKLDLLKTSSLAGVVFDGSGSSLKNATLRRETYAPIYVKNTKLYGVTKISSDSVIFTDNNVIVEDTITSNGYDRTLIVEGDFTNNGAVTKTESGLLTVSVTGNIINNGKWDFGFYVEMNGTSSQKFTNNGSSLASFKLKANVSSATTYQWYKNSSEISGATNETYTYNSPGDVNDYDAYGEYYCQTDAGNSRTITIETTGIDITAAFSANKTSGNAPLEVTFTDASTGGATSWSWDFNNDGTVDATAQNPTYTYDAAGTYTVKLTVSDGTNSDDEIKTDYITVNSGINYDVWEPVSSGVSEFTGLKSVMFINDKNGWVSGTKNTLLRTTDGGLSWTQASSGIDEYGMNDVFFANENTGWAVGDKKVFKSTDGGDTWTSQTISDYVLFTIYFTDANTGYCAGQNVRYKTTDGGSSWVAQTDADSYVKDIQFVNGVGYQLDYKNFYKTTDGNNWTNEYTFGDDIQYTWHMHFIDNNTGYIAGDYFGGSDTYGFMYKTNNEGQSWTRYNFDKTYAGGVHFLTKSYGYVVGGDYSEAVIWKTTDGGDTWSVDFNETSSRNLSDITFISSTVGIAIGEGGNIYRITLSESPVGVGEQTISDFNLYPNPANNFVTLEFGSDIGSENIINIYNINGKQVYYETTSNPTRNINISIFEKGIYLIKVVAKSGVKTKRLIIE